MTLSVSVSPAFADSHPVEIIPGSVTSGAIILCDHASNAVPADLGDLGLPESAFERHIAYDIGAAWVSRTLAKLLDAPAVLTQFSRLIIDPNRGRDDPTLVMRLSDGAVVPGNAKLTPGDVQRRLERFYNPYDAAIGELLSKALQAGYPPCLIAIHSFTPIWRGVPRPWHVGILSDADRRFADPLLQGLEAEAGLIVGDNEPYDGALSGDTIDRHATVRGLANTLVEIRQDLIATQEGAEKWALRFAGLLKPLLANPGLRAVQPHSTRTRLRIGRLALQG